MNELTENIRSILFSIGELTELVLNALSMIAVLAGVIFSFVSSMQVRKIYPGPHPRHTLFRRNFGGWLVVALEFQLGADIVGTIISPTYEQLIQLAVVAVIRTFLNYFLVKELKEQTESLKLRIEKETR